MNMNLTSHNIYSTLMCGLWIFAEPPIYRVTSYLRLLALSVLTCIVCMNYLVPIVSDNTKSLEQFELEALSSPVTTKEKISARGLSSRSWLPARYI